VDSKTIAVQFEEPHIGSVLIQMSETDDGLTVSVAADDDLTLEMLQTGSQQLETTLKENNIELLEIASLPPDMSFTQQGQQDSPFQQTPDVYRQAMESGQPAAAPGTPQRLTSSEQLNFRA
ncbi:MAG: flagellar hook-length control protein FliK, partial [Planctomycetaceae bacterium]|nr:flagellar hook-length control protein FliK [Planctomycetaceae bacterium]